MFVAFSRALSQLFSKPFRRVLWVSLFYTLLLLGAVGAAAFWGIGFIPDFEQDWLNTTIDTAVGIVTGLGLVLLLFPVATLFVGLFADDVAHAVEARFYPASPPPRKQPALEGVWLALRWTAVILLVNILLLPLYLVPIVSIPVFVIVNAWLLGREFFDAVALRHYPGRKVKSLRRANLGVIVVAGGIIALLLSVPIVNILVPLFGTAFMVHVFKNIERKANAWN